MKDDLDTGRKTPPEDHEWPGIWAALEKADKGWIITGPIHAVVSNWKALAVVLLVVAWINQPEIVAAVRVIIGAGE